MCTTVLNILFFNMLLYKQNVIIKKKNYLFKFVADIFITRTEGVIYTKVKETAKCKVSTLSERPDICHKT